MRTCEIGKHDHFKKLMTLNWKLVGKRTVWASHRNFAPLFHSMAFISQIKDNKFQSQMEEFLNSIYVITFLCTVVLSKPVIMSSIWFGEHQEVIQ